MLISPAALVLILALFLVFAGWAGIVVGRTFRDGADLRETAGNVLVMAVLFAVAALVALEYALPHVEGLLGLLRHR